MAAAPEQAQAEEAPAAPEQPQAEEAPAALEQAQAEEAPAAPEQAQTEEAPAVPEQAQAEEPPAAPEQAQTEEAPAVPEKAQAEEEPTAPEQAQAEEEPTAPEQAQAEEAPAVPEKAQAEEAPAAPEQAQAEEEPTAPEQAQAEEEPTAPEQAQAEEAPAVPEQPQAEEAPTAPEQAQEQKKEEMARRVMQAVEGGAPAPQTLGEVDIPMPAPHPARRAPFEKTPQQRAAEFDAKVDALGRQWGVPTQPAAQPPQAPAPAPAKARPQAGSKRRPAKKKAPAAKAAPAGPQTQPAPVQQPAPAQASAAPAPAARAKRGGRGWLVWLAACLVLCAAGFAAGTQYAGLRAAALPASSATPGSTPQPAPTPAPDAPADPNLWSLLLANTQNPLPDGYEPPQLATIDAAGRQVDSRIAQPLQQMIAAAEKDGAHLVVTSAYRSYERQEELFVSMIRDYLAMGYSNAEAYAATKRLRNVPGTSEHQTGLTVDIISQSYWQLDEGYAETYEAKWLKEHAAEYGFILRYPKDKTAITGTSFEPWHYRYVGVEDAQKIMAQGLCLEEYLAKVDEGVAAQVAAALENAGVTGIDTETGAASGSASPGSAASGNTASGNTASGSAPPAHAASGGRGA